MKTAVGYYRTSSATNVGADKDSLRRQQDAVQAYALAHGLEVVQEFYDAAVSGADPVDSRDGFSDMLAYLLGNGARIVLVETASRFARDTLVQITGHNLLKEKGIELIPVDAPTHFTEDTPTASMVRTILSAVSQFEKDALVARLRKARDRKRRDTGRCEGRPASLPVAHQEAARAAHSLGLSLRAVAAKLAKGGFLNRAGKPYNPESVKRMLRRPPT